MKLSTKQIVYVALLSALATILMFFPHFPVLMGFPFLKIDFSDVPAMMAAVTLHPLAGIVVELIKNLVHLSVSDTAFVGELSNFIVGSVFVASTGILSHYAFKKTLMKKKLLFILPIAVVLLDAAAVVSNYCVIGPMYFGNASDKVMNFVIYGAIPFNFIKGGLEAVAFYLLYRGVAPYIQKHFYLYR